MTQQTSPFLETKYGWNYGESGWNIGMDENLTKFSFLFDRNIDGIVSSLPSVVNGTAYFLTTDSRIYFGVSNSWYSSPTPRWFTLSLRSTGASYQFNGTSLIAVPNNSDLSSQVQAIQVTLSSLGTAAFQPATYFASQAALDVASAQASSYTDSKIAGVTPATLNYTSPQGISRTLQNKLGDFISVKDFGAVGDGVADDSAAFTDIFTYASTQTGVGIVIPPGRYIVTGNLPLGAGTRQLMVRGSGRSSRILWSGNNPLFLSGTASCDELSFNDFVVDNTGTNTTAANAVFSFPQGNTRTDFNNVHLLPNLATNKTAPSFYLCPVGKINDSINFFNCYAFVNKRGIMLGSGSSVFVFGGRIAGVDPTTESSIGLGLTGGMGGVWVVGTDLIGLTTGCNVSQDSGTTNRELFLLSGCTDSCNTGLSINDSGSYTSWTGCWAASCNVANINFAPTSDAAILNISGGTIFNAGANDPTATYSNYGISVNQFGKLVVSGVEVRNNKGRGISCNSGAKTSLTRFSDCNIHDNGTAVRAGSMQAFLAGNVSLVGNEFSSSPTTLVSVDVASAPLMDIHDNRGLKGFSLRTSPTLAASNVDATNLTGQRITAYFRGGALTSLWKNGSPVAENAVAGPINMTIVLNPGDTFKWVGTTPPNVQWDFC